MLIALGLGAKAQSFTGPTSANNGDVITLQAVGESIQGFGTTGYQITSIDRIEQINLSSNTLANGSVELQDYSVFVHGAYNDITTLHLKVTNQYTSDIRITFNVHATALFQFSTQAETITYSLIVHSSRTNPPPTYDHDFVADNNGTVKASCLWRFRSVNGNHHIYTSSTQEAQSLYSAMTGSSHSYAYEGIVGYVYHQQEPGSIPLYRYYKNGDHMWTASSAEANALGSSGWAYEGISCYVPSALSYVPITIVAYRYFSPSGTAGHFWTSDYSELGSGNASWTYEGYGFIVLAMKQ